MTHTEKFHERFVKSRRKHIVQITNHGLHDWTVIPGLTDTGGQNMYVNLLTDALVKMGYKVTIINRGGFTHPVTGKLQRGIRYKNEFARIVYAEGGGDEFIKKENIAPVIPEEAKFLKKLFKKEDIKIHLLITHYWDAAKLGVMLNETYGVKHIWIPHSLGELKKEGMKDAPKEVLKKLRLDERIDEENKILNDVDFVASTSGDLTISLVEHYNRKPELFLPPCIDQGTIFPRKPTDCNNAIMYLQTASPELCNDIITRPVVMEISRTDRTKRKDILFKAFAKIKDEIPDAILIATIADNSKLGDELKKVLKTEKIDDRTIVLGSIPREILSELYSLASVYCSPSVMEGFGMSVQEAAASKIATVASDRIPFATEYLLEDYSEERIIEKEGVTGVIKIGHGTIVVPQDNVEGFAMALKKLLTHDKIRKKIAKEAYTITIPKFTWENVIKKMFGKVGFG